jgi:glycogen phosphorylase
VATPNATKIRAKSIAPDANTNIRTGPGTDAVRQALIDNLHCLLGKPPQHATRNDWYMALAYTVRDRLMERYIATVEAIAGENRATKVVAYLSAEFLTGPHLGNSLLCLGIGAAVEEALSEVGQELSNLTDSRAGRGFAARASDGTVITGFPTMAQTGGSHADRIVCCQKIRAQASR